MLAGSMAKFTGIRTWKPLQSGLFTISTTVTVTSNWNRPKSSGDKGPQKNYLKKMRKNVNKADPAPLGDRPLTSNGLKLVLLL